MGCEDEKLMTHIPKVRDTLMGKIHEIDHENVGAHEF